MIAEQSFRSGARTFRTGDPRQVSFLRRGNPRHIQSSVIANGVLDVTFRLASKFSLDLGGAFEEHPAIGPSLDRKELSLLEFRIDCRHSLCELPYRLRWRSNPLPVELTSEGYGTAMRMLVLGDSVPWGQGLADGHKYSAIVEAAIPAFSGNRTVVAHSGATIGMRSTHVGSAPGEVPISWPTVFQQTLAADPSDVSLVLMNGGINDVDIRTILNPCTDTKDLQDDIEQYCYEDYKALLLQVRSRIPDAWIVTTGYYPILSEQSDWASLISALPSLGVGLGFTAPQHSVVGKLVSLCEQFAEESEVTLDRAVKDSGDARSLFVPLGFGQENAMFAGNSFLFGLHPVSFEPVDEVVEQRKQSCLAYFNDPLELFSLFQCMHASAGHPNIQGAARIAERVLATIQQNCGFEK